MKNDHQNAATRYSRVALKPAASSLPYNDDRPDQAAAVSLDAEDGLPVLEEVIEPDDPVFSAWNAERARTRAEARCSAGDPWQSSPDFERDILTHKLRTDLADDLEQMVSTAVSTAIERSVRDLEETLHAELLQSLGSRIDEALPRFKDDQTPKPQPTPAAPAMQRG